MKILMDEPQAILDKYSRHTKIQFGPIQREDGAVIVILPDKSNLEQVFSLNMPTVIIAGNINSNFKDTALQVGFSEEAIIVKKNDTFCSLAGEIFFDGVGVKLNDLVKLAKYAYDSDLRPEIYVWKDAEDIVVLKEVSQAQQAEQQTFQPKIQSSDRSYIQAKGPPEHNRGNGVKAKRVTKTIADIMGTATDLTIVYKTATDANSFEVASAIAQKQKALHINLTRDAKPVPENICYAHSADGAKVEVNSDHPNVVVLETDPDYISPELMQLTYDKAKTIYHVPSSHNASAEPLKMWLDSGFKLDSIVALQDYEEYRATFPAYTKTLPQILELN